MYALDTKESQADELLSSLLSNPALSRKDKAFITQLVYGVLRWRNRLDWIIELFSKRRLAKMTPWIINILRLGVYQLLFLDRVPSSAAVNESVVLAHRYGHKGTAGLVNAVLREVNRKREGIDYPDRVEDPVFYLSVVHSHPRWLVERWLGRYGFEKTEKICRENNSLPWLTIRVNLLKTSVGDLRQELMKEGLGALPCYYSSEGLRLEFNADLFYRRSFKEGLFQVQDEASILVSHLLDPHPGRNILDVCAAPGGKATHIAELMENRGKLFAGDSRRRRLKMLKENFKRLGAENFRIFCADATMPLPFKSDFDGVLVDAPCSSLGVVRRNPDIKWKRKESDIDSLTRVQLKILGNASSSVKKGGVLVYSTCSNEPEESRGIIKTFLERNQDFFVDDPRPSLPKNTHVLIDNHGYFESFPYNHGMDGFFAARLRKGN